MNAAQRKKNAKGQVTTTPKKEKERVVEEPIAEEADVADEAQEETEQAAPAKKQTPKDKAPGKKAATDTDLSKVDLMNITEEQYAAARKTKIVQIMIDKASPNKYVKEHEKRLANVTDEDAIFFMEAAKRVPLARVFPKKFEEFAAKIVNDKTFGTSAPTLNFNKLCEEIKQKLKKYGYEETSVPKTWGPMIQALEPRLRAIIINVFETKTASSSSNYAKGLFMMLPLPVGLKYGAARNSMCLCVYFAVEAALGRDRLKALLKSTDEKAKNLSKAILAVRNNFPSQEDIESVENDAVLSWDPEDAEKFETPDVLAKAIGGAFVVKYLLILQTKEVIGGKRAGNFNMDAKQWSKIANFCYPVTNAVAATLGETPLSKDTVIEFKNFEAPITIQILNAFKHLASVIRAARRAIIGGADAVNNGNQAVKTYKSFTGKITLEPLDA